ncbi:MAG TPA: glycosyltransferase, partial [Lentzea sp.]
MVFRIRLEEADVEHDRLRIAMVSVEEFNTAQRVHVAGLSAALARSGHAVTVYTRRENAILPDRSRTEFGYDVVRVPAGPALRIDEDEMIPQLGRLADRLGRAWRDAPPDVVHSHGWMSGLAGVLAERQGIPVVQTYCGLGGSSRRSQGERIVGREAARVTALSSGELAELVSKGVDRSRISVVPTGVDVRMFTPWGRSARRGTRRRVVVVRTAAPDSGLAELVEVLSHLDDVELLITGGGSRARTVALLRSSDVVVCAPRCEPIGRVSLEAMACGVPVVATAVGALADSVVDGVTGLHVQPGKPRQLAKVVRGLLGDVVRRQEFGAAGRDRASERYSWERIAADTVRA